jgi:hypothetical protein
MNVNDTLYFSCAAYASIHPNRAAALNHLFCSYGNGYEWDEETGEMVEVCNDYDPQYTVSQNIALVFDRRRQSRKAEEERQQKYAKTGRKPDPEWDAVIEKMMAHFEARRAAAEIERAKDPEAYAIKEAEVTARLEAAAEESRKALELIEKYEYAVPDDIDERLKDTKFNHWYPMCHYSKLVTFPENIAPDWLDALIETADLVLKQPTAPTYPRGHFESDEEYAKANRTALESNAQYARTALEKGTAIRRAREAAIAAQ